MDKAILRAEKVKFQARVLGQQVQKEKCMANQLEAAARKERFKSCGRKSRKLRKIMRESRLW
jgi:hypothetical protein